MFNPANCEVTSRIRLRTRRTDDFVAWQPEKSGVFSVKRSGKPVQLQVPIQMVTGSSGATFGNAKCPQRLKSSHERESSHHAVVQCPHARALQEALSQHWPLPDDAQFWYIGRDWLLLLHEKCATNQQNLTLLLWRT